MNSAEQELARIGDRDVIGLVGLVRSGGVTKLFYIQNKRCHLFHFCWCIGTLLQSHQPNRVVVQCSQMHSMLEPLYGQTNVQGRDNCHMYCCVIVRNDGGAC